MRVICCVMTRVYVVTEEDQLPQWPGFSRSQTGELLSFAYRTRPHRPPIEALT
jgi:hypothetical protein